MAGHVRQSAGHDEHFFHIEPSGQTSQIVTRAKYGNAADSAALTEVDPIGRRVEVMSGGLPDMSGHIPDTL